MRLQLLIFLLVTFNLHVVARRGGGDSGGGGGSHGGFGDGDGGDDDGESDPSQSDFNRTCQRKADFSSPLWLHRWIGTYYNGTIDLSLTVNASNTSCSDQSARVHQTYNGVLSIISPVYIDMTNSLAQGSRPLNPFIVLIYGWPTNTTEADFLDYRPAPNHIPDDVNIYLETHYAFREYGITYPSKTGIVMNSPSCDVGNITSTNSGYGFTCQYGNLFGFDDDHSSFLVPLKACNDSDPGAAYPFTAYKDDNTLLRGEFGPESADFSWAGGFHGRFSGSGEGVRDIYFIDTIDHIGNFTLRFKGSVDAEHSHQMAVKNGGNVSWVEDEAKLEANTFCSVSVALRAKMWFIGAILFSWESKHMMFRS
ncbi:uncharacterized protein NECHADRAFT_89545 [Fusarium vanettenii 77-13-4]|uniref:Uncharacterized protein n=1 Tax=Fusarium vanettenii (strain ATCC MYA-4622 / CBS 123669 / FGSC 9596 / NRRL 45880 / 77-13-4) TaxID=660122 RepID=C7ZRI5_FUSV7|nr:uncharacterized protein NECHADRAFT_89545 [Fusarium vanettenii 77-13-4]EEU33372.1 predicted protein [Fusarium vanettenii 77-13-4]